jgi:Flp pilus assembly protein TadD
MFKRKLFGRCHLLALAVVVPVAPAFAQTGFPSSGYPYPPAKSYPSASTPAPGTVQPIPPPPPIDPLAMNLKILAQNPYDVNALTRAGIGALEVGDPQAAIGFLARAEELSPRDGKIKAALGTALTMVERPEEALTTFAEALTLGVFEREIARDRGLAYDLRGDNKRAQRDYVLAAKSGSDGEVTRRHALSLGITGAKDEALKMVEPLLRKGDQSAWRARAFILAMNGDMPQADRIIRAATPPSMASSMSAFLRRLPSLTPSQRAHAVNFGTIPTTGPIYAALDSNESFRSVGNGANDGLLTPAEVSRSASSAPTSQPKPSRSELRRLEKEQRALAKLAAKGAKASGVTQTASVSPAVLPKTPVRSPVSQPPVTDPARTATTSQRVGQRIGPVDPSRLPPELRVPAKAGDPLPVPSRVTIMQGATALPPPDSARPPVRVAALEPRPLAPSTSPASTPVLEPASVPAPVRVVVDVPKPVVLQPTQTVQLPPVQPIFTAPSVAAAPSVPPPFTLPPVAAPLPTPKPAPLPAPVQSVALPPSSAAPSVIAPPAPPPIFSTPSTVNTGLPPVVKDPVQVAIADPKLPSVFTPAPVVAAPPVTSSPSAVTPVELPPSTPAGSGSPILSQPLAPPPLLNGPVQGATPSLMGPPAPSAGETPVLIETPKPVDAAAPGFTSEPAPVGEGAIPPAVPPIPGTEITPAPVEPAGNRLSSVLDGIETEQESAAAPLPTAAEIRAKRLAAQKKMDDEAKDKLTKEAEAKAAKEAETKKAAEEAAKVKANPARLWVQVATGANRSGLPITWRKLKAQAPKALGDKSAWFVSFRSTNRLLVGPVKSSGEARTLVTALSKEGIQANSYSSEAGLEVSRLGGR